jgi:uroporphyrinogen-III synthase
VTGALSGVRVVVTRPEHHAHTLGAQLKALGARVIYVPVIAIAPPESWDGLDAGLARLAAGVYEWVLFTSPSAVDPVCDRVDAGALRGVRVWAVGRTTGSLLESRGASPELVPETATSVALARALGPGTGAVLTPRVEGAPGAMVAVLRDNGWTVDEVIAYRNVPADPTPECARVREGRFDAVTFTSGSAARRFIELVAAPADLGLAPGQPPDKTVVCIGPETAAAALSAGFRVDVVAREHSAQGVADALALARDGTIGA